MGNLAATQLAERPARRRDVARAAGPGYPPDVFVDEPARGSFAYLEQPGLFSMPAVDQLRLFIERRLPAPPLTHLSGLVVEEVSEGASTSPVPPNPNRTDLPPFFPWWGPGADRYPD